MENTLNFRCHTPNLLKEIAGSMTESQAVLSPLRILGSLLYEVGERAAELNDAKLNALMCRLTIYEIADPESPVYNELLAREIMDAAKKISEP